MFSEENTTTKILSRIKSSLTNNLKEKYKIENEETTAQFLKIHGLEKSNFDFINTIEKLINEKINDVSIDPNSNKSEKTILGTQQEAINPINKAIGFDYLYKTMEELYGSSEAKRLLGEMLDLSIGISDSGKICLPYCYALDASKIVTEGRKFGQLHSKPSKRVSSYMSALCETTHQLANHLAGAIAIGTFFEDISHLCLYKEEIDLRELKTNKTFRKYLENEMQQFVHSVNHLSRLGLESAFTNISLFDRVKLRTMIKNMDWYFPYDDIPINHPKFDEETEEGKLKKETYYLDYISDYIIEIQNIFLDFFDQGDPNTNGRQYRFPIVTANLSKKKWGERWVLEDEEFLKDLCKREIYRYNIFVSEGTKVCSCCRLLSNTEMLEYAAQSNSFGAGGSVSLGSHRVCTINFMRIALESKTTEQFYKILDTRIDDVAKILKAHKQLILTLEKKGLQPFITNGWINFNRMFSTYGIIGAYEASLYAKEHYDLKKGEDFVESILTYLNSKVQETSKKYNLICNIEQIPAESFAIRFVKADKLIYGDKKINYPMLSNQFVPLWIDSTIWERLDKDGAYNKLLTGGGIVHAQIGERVTAKQAEKIIRYACNVGCEHFALNSVYSICKNNHNTFGKIKKCPECGEEIIEYMSRVVGYFVPVSAWEKTRREWEFDKRTFVKIED